MNRVKFLMEEYFSLSEQINECYESQAQHLNDIERLLLKFFNDGCDKFDSVEFRDINTGIMIILKYKEDGEDV